VHFVNNKFFVWGGRDVDYNFATSFDGINWDFYNNVGLSTCNSIAYGNEMYISVGCSTQNTHIATSSDGVNWNQRQNLSYLGLTTTIQIQSIIYEDGRFVAVGNNRIFISPAFD